MASSVGFQTKQQLMPTGCFWRTLSSFSRFHSTLPQANLIQTNPKFNLRQSRPASSSVMPPKRKTSQTDAVATSIPMTSSPRRKLARRSSHKPEAEISGTLSKTAKLQAGSRKNRLRSSSQPREAIGQSEPLRQPTVIIANFSSSKDSTEKKEEESGERGARRTPPINSGMLPLPWSGRLGYVGRRVSRFVLGQC